MEDAPSLFVAHFDPTFSLETNWTFSHPQRSVWHEVIVNADHDDWECCRSVRQIGTWSASRGDQLEYAVTGVLPGTYRFTIEVIYVDETNLLAVRSRGDIEGIGIWYFFSVNDTTHAHFQWRIVPGKKRFRNISSVPFVERILKWNHRQAMNSWQSAVDARLSTGEGR